MKQLKLNETPVRTARNFKINNVKLENIDIPNDIQNFNNVVFSKDVQTITNNNINLKYGIGNILIEQIEKHSNKKFKIIADNDLDNLKIDFKFDSNNLNLVENIEIEAKENSNSTIIIKYESIEHIQNYHNGLIRVNADKNSILNLIIVNLMNECSNNFLTIDNNIKDNANVSYTIVDFGGKNSITNYYSNIEGINANNQLNTIYLGKENQLIDLNYIAELIGEKSNVNIEVQGALLGNAKKNFKGTIDFKKGCKKATGNENENCMLLSERAKSLALPMLLCSEEDVEGNHSSSAGKIDEKELFYIMSRGFDIKEAMKLMVRAKFNKILENIKDETLLTEILNEIDKKLD